VVSEAAASLWEALEDARRTTLRLIDGITEAQARQQPDPAFSPLAWHLGHVGWQEEVWALRAASGSAPIDPKLDRIFDSFRSEKSSRGARLPPIADLRSYLLHVRARTREVLERADPEGGGPLLRGGWVFHFLANHERQHAETMAVVRLLGGWTLPHLPPMRSGRRPDPAFIPIDGGSFPLGCDDDPESWDNERCAHSVELRAYGIGMFPVTNGEWLEFMEAGGYSEDRFWSQEGRLWRSANGITAPLHWVRAGDGWERRTLAGPRPVDPSHPVAHVSWFEADAFARFAGARLPTEAEWERAASWDEASGRKWRWPWGDGLADEANLDLKNGDTTPCAPNQRSPSGALQLGGDVWEWTSTPFGPYPGFRADPYRGYSEPWFGDEHRVLRGGCHLTHPMNARASFRNWFHPGMRAIPSGLRLARDG